MSISRWINSRLLVETKQGELYPPGGGEARRWIQRDGSDVTIISRGDAFDLYIGKRTIYNVTMERRVAISLGLWLFRWWAVRTWFGFKSWLWNWTLGRMVRRGH